MVSDLNQDRFASFALINYLEASYSGKHAQFNVFAQTEYSGFDAEQDLPRHKRDQNMIHQWKDELTRNECLISADWTKPETFEAEKALALLEDLHKEVSALAVNLVKILTLQELPENEDVKFLLAAYARSTYARDTYIRGFVEYGKRFALDNLVADFEPLLPPSEEEIKHFHRLLAELRSFACDVKALEKNYLALLHASTLELPSIFRTHSHDITQLLAQFKGGLSFESAGFNPAEAELWEKASFTPAQAGYWRAYGIGPEEARAWLDAGFRDVPQVYKWKSLGFLPQTAAPWIQHSFAPGYAHDWLIAGFDPTKAKELIERGITTPPKK